MPGQVFRSVGTPDGSSWSKPGAVALANPNSKLASLLLDDQLLAVHNVGSKDRASLAISLSLTAGRTWEEVVSLHKLPGGAGRWDGGLALGAGGLCLYEGDP